MKQKYKNILTDSHTYREITQQTQLWKETLDYVLQCEKAIDDFLCFSLKKNKAVVVVFTGAGTSQFIGDIACEYFSNQKKKKLYGVNVYFESKATTNIITSPPQYSMPVVLVSFSRSGSSPESLSAIRKVMKENKQVYNLIITCNPSGKVSKELEKEKNILILKFPKANDVGFAMTSSFSCMLLISYFIFLFTKKKRRELYKQMEDVITVSNTVIQSKELQSVSQKQFERIIYLGSGILGELCKESALKLLELTAGKIPVSCNTPLGFRHGPKSFINSKTLIVVFVSSDKYIQKYDRDIIKEILSDRIGEVFVVIPKNKDKRKLNSFIQFSHDFPDYLAVFPCVLFSQILAVRKSCLLKITPDNPFPNGIVNRVVQGVTIYEK